MTSPGRQPPTAAAALVGRFERLLAESEAGLEAPSSEEIARAVDGELDAAEAALWSERLARDPGLAERSESLARFRAEAYPVPSRLLAFRGQRRRPTPLTPWLGWAAAAATILVAVVLRFGAAPTALPSSMQAASPASEPPPIPAELFSDGFEGGDPSRWAEVAPSG